MDLSKLLNKQQLEAVTTNNQRVRVVAGAGSGKTRVLTYRIAYLIKEKNVEPEHILAITFTNKVAGEMKDRVVKLVPEAANRLLIRTFHSFCAYFLRHEIYVLNYPLSFTIYDEEDQTKLIKDIVASKGMKRNDPMVKKSISFIGKMKQLGKYPDDIIDKDLVNSEDKECKQIYELYEVEKSRMYGLDFDDLLLKTNQILDDFPQIRAKWQNRIKYILIDEFQDTNDEEYKLIKHLSTIDTNLYVVGDPDQTIYTWRGANQNIILNIDKDFKGFVSIILNRNYRSTQTILTAANKLIVHNKLRVPKELFTVNNLGEPISVRCLGSSRAEAKWAAKEIKLLHDKNEYRYKDIVMLYRSSYITLEFEQELTALNIPYRIYGGLKFYQRKEVKDVIAYFNCLVNHLDDISFERIINVPKRKIGEQTVLNIKAEAKLANKSLYDYLNDIDIEKDNTNISSSILNRLKILIFSLNNTKEKLKTDVKEYPKILEDLIKDIGYLEYLAKEDDGDDRIDNVKALFVDVRTFFINNPDSSLEEYLQNIALLSAQDEMVGGDALTLMTVHTAKGLEYPVVFLVRFNEGVFPHIRSLAEIGFNGMEEERRLAYVAYTRAKEKLYITCSSGFSPIAGGNLIPSMFIKESGLSPIKEEYNNYSSFGGRKTKSYHFDDFNNDEKYFSQDVPIDQDFSSYSNNGIMWSVGDKAFHNKFGEGVVKEIYDDGTILIDFKEQGEKTLLASHPTLSKGGKK